MSETTRQIEQQTTLAAAVAELRNTREKMDLHVQHFNGSVSQLLARITEIERRLQTLEEKTTAGIINCASHDPKIQGLREQVAADIASIRQELDRLRRDAEKHNQPSSGTTAVAQATTHITPLPGSITAPPISIESEDKKSRNTLIQTVIWAVVTVIIALGIISALFNRSADSLVTNKLPIPGLPSSDTDRN